MKGRYNLFSLIISCSLLSGCAAPLIIPMLTALAPQGIMMGAGAIAGLENVDVNASNPKSGDIEELKGIKRVAILIGTQNQPQQNMPFMGGEITGIMSDNISLELMNLGYDIVERTSLDKILSEHQLQASGLIDMNTAQEIRQLTGIDAIILGNVSTSQRMSTGFMAFGGDMTSTSAVSNATIRILSLKKATSLMIITLSYKKGATPPEAAKAIAIVLAEKLKNPTGPTKDEKSVKDGKAN